jgi:phenylpyruvate tautomerase PptA (4-oxalocrotonate tautomerase family)
MPLVRIDIVKGRTAAQRRSLGEAVHRALVDALGVPAQDRFQVISEHEANELVYDRSYLVDGENAQRSDGIVIIQITLSSGRSLEQKRRHYRRITENLAYLDVRPEDVWINLVETSRENWSFGLGEASYAPAEKATA